MTKKKNDVGLMTDDYYVSQKSHDYFAKILSDYKPGISRCDTHAKGGPFFYAAEFVITITSGVLINFLYDKVKPQLNIFSDVVKEILVNKKSKFYIQVNGHRDIELYFDVDMEDLKNNKHYYDTKHMWQVFSSIPTAIDETNRYLKSSFSGLHGNILSLILKYDFEAKKWLIRETNSDSSIFFDFEKFNRGGKGGRYSLMDEKRDKLTT